MKNIRRIITRVSTDNDSVFKASADVVNIQIAQCTNEKMKQIISST